MDATKCELVGTAAKLLGVSKSTLTLAVRDGKVKKVQTEGGNVLVYMPSVRSWDRTRQHGRGNPNWIAKVKKKKR